MKEIVLTPVERGILIILMTQGKPVNQADFKKAYGLDAKRNHRLKLEDFGLIEVQGTRTFNYKLTKEGWIWLSKELTAPKPKGSMGLGPLYAALNAIGRLTKRLGLPLQEALLEDAGAQDEGQSLKAGDDYIREAAWADADESLARALQDMPVFASAIDKLKQAANGTASAEIKRTEQSAKLVFQSVRQAAAKRELSLIEEPGSEVPFDPALFDADGDTVNEGGRVRVRKAAVMRGHGARRIIIRQGLAEALPTEK